MAHGLLWILDPRGRSVGGILSIGQAVGGRINRPLSILVSDSVFGVWDADSAMLWWLSREGDPIGRRLLNLRTLDLALSGRRALEPPRMHGRLIDHRDALHVELRRGEQHAEGPDVDGFIVRLGEINNDTILTFRTGSYGEKRDGIWMCCRGARTFSPQPWWSFLSDGRLVFASCSARPPDSGENSGGGRGRGDLQYSLTFGPKLAHCVHRYCSPPASSTKLPMIVDSFSI